MRRLLILLLSVGWAPSVGAQGQLLVDYETEVQPIFTRSCATPFCHDRLTSGVQLTDYDSVRASEGNQYRELVVVPGDAEASPLYDKISRSSPRFGSRMPRGAPPLAAAEIETIRRWIDEGALPQRVTLERGDFDRNDVTNISDAILLLNFLFAGGEPPACEPLADTNSDGSVNLTDAVFLLSFLFVSGPAPEPMSAVEQAGCM